MTCNVEKVNANATSCGEEGCVILGGNGGQQVAVVLVLLLLL